MALAFCFEKVDDPATDIPALVALVNAVDKLRGHMNDYAKRRNEQAMVELTEKLRRLFRNACTDAKRKRLPGDVMTLFNQYGHRISPDKLWELIGTRATHPRDRSRGAKMPSADEVVGAVFSLSGRSIYKRLSREPMPAPLVPVAWDFGLGVPGVLDYVIVDLLGFSQQVADAAKREYYGHRQP